MRTKTRNKTLILSSLLIFALTTSCKTTASLSTKVSLGMTKEQVIRLCGKPYKQSAKYDYAENAKEIFFYKEKIWEDGGWGSNFTIINTIFVFRNGRLVAIEQGDEEYYDSKSDGYYIR